jgi:ankyrin repeat protein
MHDRAAQRILAQDPSIGGDSIYTAIVCGNRQEVARILAARPEAARQRGGARDWTPILYLAYTRFTHPPTIKNALAIAQLLLDHGADPNDFYMAGDARYSVLTGVAGEGEQDSPRQPYAPELFELLLERGAEPFDIQVLYDTHFSGDVLWWLELVYKHTVHSGRGAAWKDPDWRMFDMGAYGSGARFLLETAVKKRNIDLAEWLLAHCANPNAAPARDKRFPNRSLYELALMEFPEMADLLARSGASRSAPALDEHERFLHACFGLDRGEARRLSLVHPEYLQSPAAMFEAAKRDRPDVLALLLELGSPLEVQDRTGKRALHEAAANNALHAAKFLVERGAEIDPRDSMYNGTPIGWAAHGDKTEMVQFLSRHSRDIWTLCFNGHVDRVGEILTEDPGCARTVASDGRTPFWWLPDDEGKAMQIVGLLLAAGADPSAMSKDGGTAADWARRRGMREVATRLEQ